MRVIFMNVKKVIRKEYNARDYYHANIVKAGSIKGSVVHIMPA